MRAYIMESNDEQFYDMFNAHQNYHQHVHIKYDLPVYLEQLVDKGLVMWDGRGSPPAKYALFLCQNEDWFLDDVMAINRFDDDAKLKSYFDSIPWEELAQLMLAGNGKSGDVRNNRRVDVGFAGRNSTDSKFVDGIHVVGFHKKARESRGCGDDKSLEETIVKAGVSVTRFARHAKAKHPNLCSPMAQTKFMIGDESRRQSWSQRWAKSALSESTYNDVGEDVVFEGASAFVTGEITPSNYVKTGRHVDDHNDRGEGYNNTPTLSKIIRVYNEKEKRFLVVRIGVNIYCKNHCRLHENKKVGMDKLVEKIRRFMYEFDGSNGGLRLHERFGGDKKQLIKAGATMLWDEEGDFAVSFPADPDKDGYYSLYSEELFRVAEQFDWDGGALIEALSTIPLSPSQVTWVKTMDAVRATMDVDDYPYNLFETYVHHARKLHGGIGCGPHRRVIPSVNHPFDTFEAYQSFRNLRIILKKMFENEPGSVNYRHMMRQSTRCGGVFGVSDFWATPLVVVATALGLVLDEGHVDCGITIASTTHTAKRLRKEYNVGNRQVDLDKALDHVSKKLKVTRSKAENLVCEVERPKRAVDVFRNCDGLIKVEGCTAYRYDRFGNKAVVKRVPVRFGTGSYMPEVKWWEGNKFEASDLRLITIKEP